MNKKILIPIVVILIIAAGIGGYFVFQKPTPEPLAGKCGDGVCDTIEKANPDLCPQDCKTQETQAATVNITIDYSKELGKFSPYLFGVSGIKVDASNPDVKSAGFKLISTNMANYNPQSTNGYDSAELAKVDADINEIIKLKATPLLYFQQTTNPIKKKGDSEHYSAYVKAITEHLSDTWPGQKFILHFGNEPDGDVMTCIGQAATKNEFWDGTRQEFFRAYAVWAKAAKSVDANFIVGGIGVAVPIIPPSSGSASGGSGQVSCWITDFLDYAKANNVPVDWFSFHAYSTLPRILFYDNVAKLAAELKKYTTLSPLFGAPLLANQEWNMGLNDDVGIRNLCFRNNQWDNNCVKRLESYKTAYRSAHNIVALINMIDQGLQLNKIYVPLYQNVPSKSTQETEADVEGSCRFFTLVCTNETRNLYYALKGFNWLAGTAHLAVSGGDHANFAAIAGKTNDGITIILGNYNYLGYEENYPPENIMKPFEDKEYQEYKKKYGELKVYNKYNLTLNNLPWILSQKITYERYLVDDSHKLELVESQTLSGNKEMKFSEDIAAPSVQVIKLRVK